MAIRHMNPSQEIHLSPHAGEYLDTSRAERRSAVVDLDVDEFFKMLEAPDLEAEAEEL